MDKESLKLAVYEIVRIIPEGRATSYGAIARAVGYPNQSRLIGRIMGKCDSFKLNIPAHRVVNSQGMLSGKEAFGSSGEMQKRLEEEGIEVINDRIKNWKIIFWDPIREIRFEE